MKPISRRRFIASSAATLAAAGATAIVGCERKSGAPAGTGAGPRRALTAAGSRGSVLRAYNFDALQPDTLDPHLAQMGPIANVHAAIYSRLLSCTDAGSGALAPDLLAAMPEQPDKTTYLLTLREGAGFHDTPRFRTAYPQTAGRALTAGDVQFSIERQLDANSPQARRFIHRSGFMAIDKITVTGARTLKITTTRPTAPFVSYLAGRRAFIVAPETVGAGGQIASDAGLIGTGPFVLEAFQPGKLVSLRRNAEWFARDDDRAAGIGRPYLAGYDAFYTPQEDAFQRIAFERANVDTTGFSDVRVLDQEHKANLADIVLEESDAGGLLASRLLLDRAPFKDDRVRRAIHLAIDRAGLAALLYPPVSGQASAKLTGPVTPLMGQWSIAPPELERRPGYRSDAAGRAADLAQAKQLWSAALGGQEPGEVRVLFAGVPRLIPDRAVAFVQQQLRDALGLAITPVVDPTGGVFIAAALARNIDGATDGVAPFTFAFEDGGYDVDSWLYPQFRSGQPMNTYRLQDAQLDAMLDKERGEFSTEARRKLGLDVQDYLIANVNARLEYLAPIERRLTWGYVRNSHMPAWYGETQHLADTWIDTSNPASHARPA
ncbi:MAG TPA: ABC transporter substrate-binding protein [Dehalococcoidia bacterium]|nr:ABC transporter substrate-binding protein [Dehalococcoidia bacterium]